MRVSRQRCCLRKRLNGMTREHQTKTNIKINPSHKGAPKCDQARPAAILKPIITTLIRGPTSLVVSVPVVMASV